MQFTKLTRPYVTDLHDALESLYPGGEFTAVSVTTMQVSPERRMYMDRFWTPALDHIMHQVTREMWGLGLHGDDPRIREYADFFRYVFNTPARGYDFTGCVNKLQDALYGVMVPDVFLNNPTPEVGRYPILVLYLAHDQITAKVKYFVLHVDQDWPARTSFYNIFQANQMLAGIRAELKRAEGVSRI